MHLSIKSLLENILREEQPSSLQENQKQNIKNLIDAIDAVENDIKTGKISYSEVMSVVRPLEKRIRSANMKYAASKRTKPSKPGFRKPKTTAKPPVTKRGLPLEVSDYYGTPNELYYALSGADPKSGMNTYRLAPKYENDPRWDNLSQEEIQSIVYPDQY